MKKCICKLSNKKFVKNKVYSYTLYKKRIINYIDVYDVVTDHGTFVYFFTGDFNLYFQDLEEHRDSKLNSIL